MKKENSSLPTGSNITFKEDPATGDVSMYVCGELYSKKNRAFKKSVLELFKDELADKKDFVCPTEFDNW